MGILSVRRPAVGCIAWLGPFIALDPEQLDQQDHGNDQTQHPALDGLPNDRSHEQAAHDENAVRNAETKREAPVRCCDRVRACRPLPVCTNGKNAAYCEQDEEEEAQPEK